MVAVAKSSAKAASSARTCGHGRLRRTPRDAMVSSNPRTPVTIAAAVRATTHGSPITAAIHTNTPTSTMSANGAVHGPGPLLGRVEDERPSSRVNGFAPCIAARAPSVPCSHAPPFTRLTPSPPRSQRGLQASPALPVLARPPAGRPRPGHSGAHRLFSRRPPGSGCPG